MTPLRLVVDSSKREAVQTSAGWSVLLRRSDPMRAHPVCRRQQSPSWSGRFIGSLSQLCDIVRDRPKLAHEWLMVRLW